ncbi:hypothetical protein MSAN_01800500 [Mycena sanguinolenta]|uniref:Uncharacterized protein n=1 Tax=Mycena sanguinolenta TaxID=230812 RepID=A0A8H7CQP0_9AGAR|nr:hypothetical protein MSAN_01800500 [Mycena sanguinolenta]
MSSDSDPILSTALSKIDTLLDRFGFDILHDVVFTIAESIFCSAYGIFFGVALYSIFRKGLKSRAAIVMLCVVVYLYAASVAQWAMNAWIALQGIHSLLMVPDVPIFERPDLADANLDKVAIPVEVLWVFNMIIGDSVVIWRTWAVYLHRISAIVMPGILLLMSLTFGLIDLGCTNYAERDVSPPAVCTYAAVTGWAFSVATNVSCTILIGLKAWKHRKITRELNLTAKARRMSSEKILSILVESGAIYSLLWLTQVISYINIPRNSPALFLEAVLAPMGNQMAGLYPTLIIVIVNFRRTIWDEEPSVVHIDNSLHWAPNSNRSGMADTFGTQHGLGSGHIQSAIHITSDKSVVDAGKHPGLAGDYEV